ncbi:MAG: hypothetical protein ACF8PN_09890 [Phycisphaerales bacterium]
MPRQRTQTKTTTATLAALLATVALANRSDAQQSFYNPSAAQPSTGTFLFRQTAEYMNFGNDPSSLRREIEQFRFNTQLAYGVTKDLTVMGQVPLYHREVDSPVAGVSSDDFNVGDAHIMLKYRFWQRDTGPIDTMRASVLAGLDIPTGQDPFGNDGWDPMIGAVFTSIQGRHGLNAAGRYWFNTSEGDGAPVGVHDGLEDTLLIDTSYLYRLSPEQYAADTHGAWYAVAELNGSYETNGDRELRFAPGIMYEARDWVFELTAQFPVYDDLDHRPELDYSIGVGLRYLF